MTALAYATVAWVVTCAAVTFGIACHVLREERRSARLRQRIAAYSAKEAPASGLPDWMT